MFLFIKKLKQIFTFFSFPNFFNNLHQKNRTIKMLKSLLTKKRANRTFQNPFLELKSKRKTTLVLLIF